VICVPCRNNYHDGCPEIARQNDPYISALDKGASEWCYCAHRDSYCRIVALAVP
jgi:hypothetical protein